MKSIKSLCPVQRKAWWDCRVNTYQWMYTMPFSDSSSYPSSDSQKSWASASVMNDFTSEAANSTVYLHICLQQKWGQLSKTPAIWLGRGSICFPNVFVRKWTNRWNQRGGYFPFLNVGYESNFRNGKGHLEPSLWTRVGSMNINHVGIFCVVQSGLKHRTWTNWSLAVLNINMRPRDKI